MDRVLCDFHTYEIPASELIAPPCHHFPYGTWRNAPERAGTRVAMTTRVIYNTVVCWENTVVLSERRIYDLWASSSPDGGYNAQLASVR